MPVTNDVMLLNYFLGEAIWLDLDLISEMISFCKGLFPSVSYAYSSVPTYTSGVIGYIICSTQEVFELCLFFKRILQHKNSKMAVIKF